MPGLWNKPLAEKLFLLGLLFRMQSQGWELFLFKIRPFTVLQSQGLWPFPSVPLPWALPHFGFPLEVLMDHPGMSPKWLSLSAPWIPRQVIAVHETAFDFPNKNNSMCHFSWMKWFCFLAQVTVQCFCELQVSAVLAPPGAGSVSVTAGRFFSLRQVSVQFEGLKSKYYCSL